MSETKREKGKFKADKQGRFHDNTDSHQPNIENWRKRRQGEGPKLICDIKIEACLKLNKLQQVEKNRKKKVKQWFDGSADRRVIGRFSRFVSWEQFRVRIK